MNHENQNLSFVNLHQFLSLLLLLHVLSIQLLFYVNYGTKSSYPVDTGGCSFPQGVNWLKCEADHSLLYHARV